MPRWLSESDLFTAEDLGSPEASHALATAEGEILVPRPRPGFVFVGWAHRNARDEAWEPVEGGMTNRRYVAARYARAPA